jgi:hypothetical protein
MSYWTVPRDWQGQSCVIVCGGPSLSGFDFDRLRGRNIIAINSSFRAVPFAQYLVFGDGRWWMWNRPDAVNKFGGTRICLAIEINDVAVKKLRKAKPPGLSHNPEEATMQRTSTTAAINVALHLGVSEIILAGLDLKAAPDGKTHHHEPHAERSREGCWDQHLVELEGTVLPLKAAGISVVNASLESRAPFWPKRRLEDIL